VNKTIFIRANYITISKEVVLDGTGKGGVGRGI